MNHGDTCPVRLAGLSLAAKLMLTLFLLLVGSGYLVATANIYVHHHDADLDPAMSLDDLRRVYHGIRKEVTQTQVKPSEMQREVSPGGRMRKHLEKGGPASVKALVAWLEAGAKEDGFGRTDAGATGPSPREVIAQCCIKCHNAGQGDASDIPYAADPSSPPDYQMVARKALPDAKAVTTKKEIMDLPPTGLEELIQITHVHIFTISTFCLIVGVLFLLTGVGPTARLLIGPLPLLGVCLDIGGWWLARPFEPFIYMIAVGGAFLGIGLGLQILCVLGSMWLGRRRAPGAPQ